MTFVRSTTDDLLNAGGVAEIPCPALINNPLTVPDKAEKLRLVLDCRHINRYLNLPKCKLEGVETMTKILTPNSWSISFDL